MHRVSVSPGFAVPPPSGQRKPWHSDTLQKEGHPAIWKDGKLLDEACRWLNEEIVPTRESPKTWTQAAQSLLTWLDFLEAADIDWRHATKDDLTAYRDAYLGAVSPQTGQEYSPNTVRTRMVYIVNFINFAVEQDWIDSDLRAGSRVLPPRRHRPIDSDALAHIRKGAPPVVEEAAASAVRLNKLLPKAGQDDTVRVLRREELNALLGWAGPRPSERTPEDGGSDRDYIVFALGWAVGLRVQEVADVPVLPFLEMVPNPQFLGEFFKLSVRGKGNKTRPVDVPAWLVIDIQAYIDGERRRALHKRGRNARESQLILNSEHSTRTGRPMTKAAMQALMERACEGAGLMMQNERVNPETGEVAVTPVPRFSMHCLRHTYAVMTYHNQIKSEYSNLDAWKYIQEQLGHKSPQTTINTYLKHLSTWADVRQARSLLEVLGR